jgi:hypothetical protein
MPMFCWNMPILDYTTRVPVARTVAEIEARLAKAKAEAILKEYDSDGMVSALSFRIPTEFGVLTFLLPANIQRVYQVICSRHTNSAIIADKRTGSPRSLAQSKTGWKRNWP